MPDQLLETRSFACRAMPVSASAGDEDFLHLHGTAILFEQWQRVAEAGQAAYSGSGGTREKVTANALRVDVQTQQADFIHKVKALVNHRQDKYLASTDSGLKLKRTQRGLDFEMRLPKTSLAKDTIALAQAEGSLPVSIGFVGRGRGSKVTKKPVVSDDPENPPKELELPTPKTQTGRLDGSDYTEGTDPRNGRRWRVYHTLDLREISLLQGLDPAWQGVTAKPGTGNSGDERSRAMLDYYERRAQCFL